MSHKGKCVQVSIVVRYIYIYIFNITFFNTHLTVQMLKVNFFLCKDKLVKVAQLTGVVESQVIERDRVRGKV